ncbi:MAG TPA: glycosyltransferase [Candidatus Didemnitutus sp.]|nr:glycosyltransferase [Candidatus Didemnitutus sp.]
MKPLVSILIPAYNASQWLGLSIRSALDQTWPSKEIIVVDDGSRDDTLAVARAFEREGVQVVTQANQGAAAARNHAYALSRGELIQWLDADDLLAPGKIEHQMELRERCSPRALLSGPWGHFYFRTEKARFAPNALWHDLSPHEWLCRKMADGYFMQTATWLVPRSLSEAAGPWNTALLGDDDGEYFCRILLASDGVRFSPESRVLYREVIGNRLSHVGRSTRKLEAHFHSMKLHIGYLRSLADDARTREVCVKYLQRYLFYFHRQTPAIVAEMEKLARELGGELHPPRTRAKYYWIQKLFGWNAAMSAQLFFPRIRSSLSYRWDRFRYRGDASGHAPVTAPQSS